MAKPRRKYDEEFKKRAVALSNSRGNTVRSTAEGLGIHPNLLQRWKKYYTQDGEKTAEAKQQEEAQALRKRIAELEEENDLLKKASAYFAAHQKKYR